MVGLGRLVARHNFLCDVALEQIAQSDVRLGSRCHLGIGQGGMKGLVNFRPYGKLDHSTLAMWHAKTQG